LDESKADEDMPARKKLDIKNDENEDKVVMIDYTEKKKSFLLPVLLLSSTGSHSEAKSPEKVVVRSFKDGKHIEVHPKDVKEFSKESAVNSTLIKGENPSLKSAHEYAVKYIETKQLPSNWNDDGDEILKNESSDHSSSTEAESDGDENDRNEFLEKLNKFLGEKGTPLLRSPVLGHRDLDLYKLFKIVSKMKGMDKVDSWHTVYKKMSIPVMTTTACYHIKNAYKRYLYDYEIHTRQEDDNPISKKAKKSEKSSSANTSNDTAAKSSSSNTSNNTTAKSSDSNTSNNTTAKSSGSNTSSNTAANSKQDEETLIGSDSEKDLKELPLCNDNKLLTQHKPASKRGRGRRRARSNKALKSPSSPGLSPLSPCSPKSISSVSASDSTGCPSPADNYCDVRELRGKIDLVLRKSNEKGSTNKGDDLRDSKSDLSDKIRGNDDKDTSNCKTRKLTKDKTCKEVEIVVKLEKNIANVEINVENKTEAGDNLTKDDESTCKEGTLLKEDEKQNCKNSEKESNLKEDSVNDKEDLKKIQDGGSPMDKDGGDDPDDGGDKTVHHMDTPMDDEGQEGTDVEDAVDVVNSPSGTSETVDSDDRGERKADTKPKKKGEGKNGAKSNDGSDDVDDLEYKLNDRIDVRYGRGRNATIYHAKITCVDPYAEEGLYYLVHYQGWNARHDEWIGNERIIGRGAKQTRKRTIREPTKSIKPTPKPAAKPIPKPVAKKNGKNGAGHIGRPPGSKGRKRTPSPTMNMVASGRNGNGRASKTRKDNASEKTEPSSEVKYTARITRRNSLTLPTQMS
ncbi:AT-rich interactive domain-containing 4B-like isoform X2, partial [Paramuricea clavata]